MEGGKNLLKPYTYRGLTFKNRMMNAALTRCRGSADGTPGELMAKYYASRAGFGILLSECASCSLRGNAFNHAGSLWKDEQIEGWKKVVDGVHANGGMIFMQIYHGGRQTHPD